MGIKYSFGRVQAERGARRGRKYAEAEKNPGAVDQTVPGFFSEKKRGKKMKKNDLLCCLYYSRGVLKNKGINIKKVLSK